MPRNDTIDAVVPLLYESVLDQSRWDAALAAVAAAFGAPRAHVAHYSCDLRNRSLADLRMHGWDADIVKVYTQYYHTIDPASLPGSRAKEGDWLADEALFDRRARDQQEFAVDFALPRGIGWLGGGAVERTSADVVLWFGVQRHPDDAPFGEEGARVFSRLLPHLQRVAQLERRMKQLAHGQTIAQSSLDTFKAAVCVVDRSRRAHLLNRSAESLLGRAEALMVRGGRLLCSHATLDEHLGQFVTQACGRVPQGGAFQVPRQGAALPLHVMVMPLPERYPTATSLAREPLALVVVMDPQAPHLAREAYQCLFGLTDTEAALLFALVNGDNLAQWAGRRGVSNNTARTHLASVFAKTGVDSQARLMRLAKTLPAAE